MSSFGAAILTYLPQFNLLLLCICLYFAFDLLVPRLPYPASFSSFSAIARRDLSHIGAYNDRTRISMRYWTYSIEAALYLQNFRKPLLDVFLNWNEQHNYDPDCFILNGIQDGHTKFLNDIQEAEENNKEVAFSVSSEYDWHNYPLSFCNNEFIRPDVLVNLIDTLIEVSS